MTADGSVVERSRNVPWTVTTFRADVTIPVGHPCMGGGWNAVEVVDPLEAIGFVLAGGDLGKPVVVVSVDWCEIRNEAYDLWRETLAAVAGTDRERVLVTAIHQHEAPVVDPNAQRILEAHGAKGAVCDPAFADVALERVRAALADAIAGPATPVTHIGIGRARVEHVASNRRHALADGTISYHRTSASHTADAHAAPEGTIDPWLTTLSFWNETGPVLALSHYAVHPMSYYGQGGISADFIGLARRARQRELAGVVQIYASGCSGNVTAGKYNDGAPANRPVLAARIEAAMANAWAATQRHPLQHAAFRSVPLRFEPRGGPGYSAAELAARIDADPDPFGQCLAALGLSWRQRTETGQPVDLPVLDLGPAILTLLPGEAYVEYQLRAQALRPDAVVVAMGYGESGTGYIPTALQLAEGDENLGDWYWVSETAEAILMDGLERALVPDANARA
jgi:hypothetical protein